MRIAAPLRTLAQRSAFALLLVGALGVMVVGKARPESFEQARIVVTDLVAPFLGAISQPVATASRLAADARSMMDLKAENDRLRRENERLKQWQAAARSLDVENRQLRGLLNYQPSDARRYRTARVIGDKGGAFLHSVLINEGAAAGVGRGQAAITGDGLIGRVASVGDRSARVLLITDINSRIPVVIEATRVRGVLAGDNSAQPRLTFTSANALLAPGQRIVTSGHGDVFPPGLPVGLVATVGEDGVRVAPFASANRMEYLQLVDYGREGVVGDAPAAPDASNTTAAAGR